MVISSLAAVQDRLYNISVDWTSSQGNGGGEPEKFKNIRCWGKKKIDLHEAIFQCLGWVCMRIMGLKEVQSHARASRESARRRKLQKTMQSESKHNSYHNKRQTMTPTKHMMPKIQQTNCQSKGQEAKQKYEKIRYKVPLTPRESVAKLNQHRRSKDTNKQPNDNKNK